MRAEQVERSATDHNVSPRAVTPLDLARLRRDVFRTPSKVAQDDDVRRRPQSSNVYRARAAASWNYRRGRLLGTGIDGKVYLAVNSVTKEHVAIKEVLLAHNTQLKTSDRLEKQVAVIRSHLDMLCHLPPHRHITRHMAFERTTCALNVIMEYVAGGSLQSLLLKLGPFHESVIRVFTRQLCQGLAYLHESGIVHCDIKGANCLLGIDGTVKIADFGSCYVPSLVTDQKDHSDLRGTSMWMSPESAQSAVPASSTDMWSLGCTVVEMATGKSPWHEAHFANEWAAIFHISQCGRGPPIPSHLSRQAHSFLRQCFEVDPSKRLTAMECLEHPFLSQPLLEGDDAPEEMRPPSPDELDADDTFAGIRRSPRGESCDGWSSPSYSNASSFAVYDQAFGDAEEIESSESDGEGSLIQSKPQNIAGELVRMDKIEEHLQSQHASEVSVAESRVRPQSFSTLHNVVGRTSSLKSIPDVQWQRSIVVGRERDEHGMGLAEPVLLHVLSFLDAACLCAMTQVSRPLNSLVNGAKEVLWKPLFLHVFGTVDYVRSAMRKDWKEYYRNSHIAAQYDVNDDFAITRQLCQSAKVFEGVDLRHGERSTPTVVVKREVRNGVRKTICRDAQGTAVKAAARLLQRTMRPRANTTPQPTTGPMLPAGLTPKKPLRLLSLTLQRDGTPTPLREAPPSPPPDDPPHGLPLGRTASAGALAGSPARSLREGRPFAPREGRPTQFAFFQPAVAILQAPPPPHAEEDPHRPAAEEGGASGAAEGRDRGLLHHQHRMLRHLETHRALCVPRPIAMIDAEGASYLVTTALGPALHELLHYCGNHLSLRTVCHLGIRLVNALEAIHDRDIVHGNVTPRNIVMGTGSQCSDTFMVNFSFACYHRNPKNGRLITTSINKAHHAVARKNNEFMWFCSQYVQDKFSPAMRDDIISLGYVLCYLHFGSLPWIKERTSRQEIMSMKKTYDLNPILPMSPLLKHGYALRQWERPNYAMLRDGFANVLHGSGWSKVEKYDWSVLPPQLTMSPQRHVQ